MFGIRIILFVRMEEKPAYKQIFPMPLPDIKALYTYAGKLWYMGVCLRASKDT